MRPQDCQNDRRALNRNRKTTQNHNTAKVGHEMELHAGPAVGGFDFGVVQLFGGSAILGEQRGGAVSPASAGYQFHCASVVPCSLWHDS